MIGATGEFQPFYSGAMRPPIYVTNPGAASNHLNDPRPKHIILLGQSNASGRAPVGHGKPFDAVLRDPFEALQMWVPELGFQPLDVPFGNPDTNDNSAGIYNGRPRAQRGQVGTELPIARMAALEQRQLYMTKVSDGGTYTGQWVAADDYDVALDGSVGDAGFLDALAWTAVRESRAALIAAGVDTEPVLINIIGENNAGSITQRPRFGNQIRRINARWRSRLGASLRIIHPYVVAHAPESHEINRVLRSIEDEDAAFVGPTEAAYSWTKNPADKVHRGYQATVQLGCVLYREVVNPSVKIYLGVG